MAKNIFQVRQLEEFTLGEYLKNRRRELKLALGSAAERTAISRRYLKALEGNDFDRLPPEVYARGFIARYAKFLELDPDKAIFLYEKSHSGKKIVFPQKIRLPFLKLQMFLSYRNIIFAATFLLMLVLVIYLVKVVYPIYQKPSFQLNFPPNCPFSTRSEAITVSGNTQPESEIWVNQEKLLVDKEGNFQCPLYLKEGENVIKFRIVNKFGRERNKECVIRKTQ
jgi:cytoskeletal protein RodZ